MMKKLLISFVFLGLTTACSNNNSYDHNSSNHVDISEPTIKSSEVVSNDTNFLEEDLSTYFIGYEGCIVLFDKSKNEYAIYNEQKSRNQVPPNSSFKIVNSLIGLETKVLEDENTTLKWDGKEYPVESWNKDHTLKSAISNSVVWYYQNLASQVGEEKMQDYVNKVNYGNKDISGGITDFWLQSSLQISPLEQVDLLREFYDYQLPFSKRNIDIVKKMIVLSEDHGAILSGKTGSGSNPDSGTNGWFIGYVEKDNHVYIFATHIQDNASSDQSANGQEAKEITLQILKDKGLY